MPRINIHLYASLRRYVGNRPSVELEIVSGTTVGAVLTELGIPAAETRILFVDHRAASLDHPLSGGEEVGLFPAIGGG